MIEYREAGLPSTEEVRVTHDELVTLAEMVGDGVSEDHLLHLARAMWVVRYARLTGQSAASVERDQQSESEEQGHLVG